MKGGKSALTRRGFLSASLAGLAAAGWSGLNARTARAQNTPETSGNLQGEIVHRQLGRTKLKLPVVNMGVMNASNPEVVQASYELGVRLFDTAARYQFGRNEQMVGDVIKRLGVRDKVVVITKVLYEGQRRSLRPETSKEACLKAVDASLRRLGMDHVDIVLLHSLHSAEELRDPVVPGIMEAMTELKKQRKIRFTGISTHEQMAAVIDAAVEDGFFDVILTSINVTMAGDAPLLAAIKNAADKGIGVIAMKTQAGGARFPNPVALHRYSSSTVATACLKWVLHNDSIAMAIPGYTNFQHMREDLSVARNLEYTPEEREFLLDQNLELGFGFCRQCGDCLASCERGTDLPRLMRTHMYAAQYANFHAARTALDGAPPGRGLGNCSSCTACTARCAHAVDIPRRIAELKLLYT